MFRAAVLVGLLAVGCIPDSPDVPAPPPPAAPSAPPRLEVIAREPRGSDEFRALGLGGENKPNGIQYRLRQSVPAETPTTVPRMLDGLPLFIADPVPAASPAGAATSWLAFYRTPLAESTGERNAGYRALLFAPSGERLWDLDLNCFLSRPTDLEIQDIRYADGELYFNEACQSYAREAGGACSALVRVDPERGTVEWRTPPLTSNNIFLLHGSYAIAGYGFTAEPDSLFLVRRAMGEVVARQGLGTAHSYLEVRDDRLTVVTQDSVYTFALPPEEH